MNINDKKESEKKISTTLCYYLLLCLLPFILIIGTYIHNPSSDTLNNAARAIGNIPGFHSLKNPILSKLLNAYIHTAPLTAIILFMFTNKEMKLKNNISTFKALKALFSFTLFNFIIIYCFLFKHTELTNSGRILKAMSLNSFSLSFFYISLYLIIFIFSYFYLWACIGTYRVFYRGE
ncbi:colicin immunity protein [Salmonella enterica subsp. enterica]|uniref:Colicin immunity protein n=1 Tax=Salmonella enterica subsp. enterica serovar Aqua TaxID=1302615 RepID=A0A5X6EX57_SALET|nr:colicin immunity protein [Salmonella enterica subsp. enterica serovar Bareilly]ECA3795393.1 colicin immunity protein [Salmonella enterica subsp. enterica serovar Aqua]EGN1931155.1 colicin immunity protein Cui [Salmonella enterica]HCM8928437.1 colicin immunity protein Cui [Salmonella enterica subsp. enterica serovar Paratyphi B]ECH1172512.1 colicin immunity protein [Salmonella enterica subsp. enterica serovar Aqua]